MAALRPRFRHAVSVPLVALFSVAFPDAATAQSSARTSVGQCAVCTSRTSCELSNQSGANNCTVSVRDGCTYDLSLCVVAMDRLRDELKVDPEEMLTVGEGRAALALAPVGGARYAAWNCAGEVIRVVERRRDGRIVELPLAPYRERYAYARMATRAARAAERGARA